MKSEKENDEFYEEMERDNTEEKLINSEKKPKKTKVSKYIKLAVIFLISIVFIIYLISKNYNKMNIRYELSEKIKNKLNPSEMSIKLNFTFELNENNTIYQNVKIWGEHDFEFLYSKIYKETIYISALSQFPSGNFIAYTYQFMVIYDNFLMFYRL